MIKQYEILVSCQSEVRGAKIPDMQKFRLEVQLVECKQLLLGNLFNEGAGVDGVQEDFSGLHEDFARVCSSGRNDVGVSMLVSRLNNIMRQLKGD